MSEHLLTIKEAAKILSISQRSCWTITHPRGPLPCVRIGRSVRYATDDLRSYIDAQRSDGGAA